MKKVEGYQLSNGVFVIDYNEAVKLENELKSNVRIDALCDMLLCRDMHPDDIAETIKANRYSFFDACDLDYSETT